jgi:hypothetical protein
VSGMAVCSITPSGVLHHPPEVRQFYLVCRITKFPISAGSNCAINNDFNCAIP